MVEKFHKKSILKYYGILPFIAFISNLKELLKEVRFYSCRVQGRGIKNT